jgi:hypothetical protein
MQEETGVTPKALASRPKLAERWGYSKSVFDELSGSRQYSMNGAMEIPVTAFISYAVLYGFSRQEAMDTWEDVAVIDSLWLGEIAKRKKATQKGT